jgi:hypothetical protein
MKDEIAEIVIRFHDQLKADNHHIYKSWEHCYTYFSQEDLDEEVACLHLGFYLASWGMYRGSSFLLWKDYLIHKEVVRHLLQNIHLRDINFIDIKTEQIEEISDLVVWVKNWYKNNITFINGERKKINVTDTLATKIILGTLGCVPAYDRYFINGIRKTGLKYSSINLANYSSVIAFYKMNHSSFERANLEIFNATGLHYPAMELLDMYFWQIGLESYRK